MVIQRLCTYEYRTYGQRTSKDISALSRLQVAWRYSKSLGAWRAQSYLIVTLTPRATLLSRENSQPWTGTTMAIIRNPNHHEWCTYCKGQYGANTLKGQKIAMWLVTGTKGQKTYYCNDCIAEITHWACNCSSPRTCTNRFDLNEQIATKQPPQVEMSF